MSIHSQKFATSEPIDIGQRIGVGPDHSASDALPLVPATLLDQIFKHLNADERTFALLHRLVPIAWLPNMTLYADASRANWNRPCDVEVQVVARIQPGDFDIAVSRNWGQILAENAVMNLSTQSPWLSARSGLPGIFSLLAATAILVLPFAVLPVSVVSNALGLISSGCFLGIIWLRLFALAALALGKRDEPECDDANLPLYSVLVPLFREVRVLPQIIHALQKLNYPARKLDIKLILEESDTAMIHAVQKIALPPQFEVLVVPLGSPQTKPRALNYALQFARGSLLTIYDAEDVPEPMQLRKAARKFARGAEHLACLQAELAFYNSNENWLTRQFTIEYAVLFKLILPSLASAGWPLPLSGTSNHFRIKALRAAGGWDAHNVTEDADLGIRLSRLGYSVATFMSITYEEASSTPRNWLKQRARWLKGFLITWLVHMRQPVTLFREVGLSGFLVLQANLVGVVGSAVLHPLFLFMTIWKLAGGGFASDGAQEFLDSYFVALMPISWLVMILVGARSLRTKGIRGWSLSLITVPIYWLCISVAGYLALWEFLRSPFHWNKTQHGISRLMEPPPQRQRRCPISRP